MVIQEYIKKSHYIISEEGVKIFGKRLFNVLIVKLKRPFIRDHQNVRKWKTIRNRYKGNRAFLIGNGPSLNRMPLYLLKSEYTMCFNRFDLMFERLNWKPTMYSTIDDRVAVDTKTEINRIIPQVKYAFFPDINPYNIDFRKFIDSAHNVYWVHLDGLDFSLDLPRAGINKTVANVGLQILAYMGFNPIYLIGVDMEYKAHATALQNGKRDVTSTHDDDPNHFDPRYFGKNRKYHYPRMIETMERFRVAKRFFDKEGTSIFNAGVGGKLDMFPRTDFDSLFNFTGEEEIKMVVEPIREYVNGLSLQEIFDKASLIERLSDWESGLNSFITNEKLGFDLIPKAIFTHIPLGPYKGEYYFFRRPLLG